MRATKGVRQSKGGLGFLWLCLLGVLLPPAAQAADPVAVSMREEPLVVPTYQVGPAEKNPIFYSGRSYQGAKGPVYPYPLMDRLTDVKQDKSYRAVWLENRYVQFSVLPELGGRVFSGMDKTNQYDFVYRQHVVKPALIGMVGAWISGGIEWNIPHHHRASTFMPVDCKLVENPDGSKTVWLGEIELRHRMKWLVGLTLRPDRSYLEATVKLFNRTPFPHSMLYFSNLAVHANPQYQVIFPPGTEYGTQHGKREFVSWPIGGGTYAGLDRTGVDLSWWKNHPTPVSIFAWNYEDDFFGGYDHGREAGVVHVADHHLCPGKKFFEFSNSDEGRTWDKVLTDNDGPYLELMSGAFSDNQPDYSWVQPYEVRTVKQYWYPIRRLGGIKNANLEGAVNLGVTPAGNARLAFNTTAEHTEAWVLLKAEGQTLFEERIAIGPEQPYVREIALPAGVKAEGLRASLVSADRRELVAYQPVKPRKAPMPAPVVPPPPPKEVKTNEELYLAGLRLEQFHNPAIEPYPYYEEALKRDPGDSRANTALAILYAKRGMFAEAEKHANAAIERLTRNYTTPKDGEAYYYLGVILKAQERFDAAAEALHKAAWSHAWRTASYYALAEIACRQGKPAEALGLVDRSLAANAENTKALGLKAALLRKLNRPREALAVAAQARAIDPLDYWAASETHLALAAAGETAAGAAEKEVVKLLRGAVQSYLELAADYAACGLWEDAIGVLTPCAEPRPGQSEVDPMVCYDLAYYEDQMGRHQEAWRHTRHGIGIAGDYCFPFRLESIGVLRRAMERDPRDARPPYLLGNLLYDLQPKEAIRAWELARSRDPFVATVHRNLGLAYAQIDKDLKKAMASLEEAIARDPKDPRLFAELDSVYEAAGVDHQKRLKMLEGHHDVVAQRDEALLREISLLLLVGRHDRAIELLDGHHFHLWEGQSGVHDVYVDAHLLRGRQRLAAGQAAEALKDFAACLEYPDRFETGKPYREGGRLAQIHYALGTAQEALRAEARAKEHFERATGLRGGSPDARYWQGLAWRKLGQEAKAAEQFESLLRRGRESLDAKPAVDFFAKFGFQPSAQLRQAQAHYLLGLGLLGKNETSQAKAEFQQAVQLDLNHLWAQTQLAGLK